MRAATGTDNRALVELTPGRTMLDYVLAAIQAATTVNQIIVVGDVPISPDFTSLPSGSSFLENLSRGVQALPPADDRVLIVTSDIPFITSEAVDDFVKKSLDSEADLTYPIIPMEQYRAQYAAMKRTTLRTKEGEFTGGNVMLMSAKYIRNHQATITNAYAARKDVFRLGKMLGWGLLAKVLVSQTIAPSFLNLVSLENGVSNLLGHGARAKAIITSYASLGTDVDKPGDVEEARRILSAIK